MPLSGSIAGGSPLPFADGSALSVRSKRQRASLAARRALAMNPKWRMRCPPILRLRPFHENSEPSKSPERQALHDRTHFLTPHTASCNLIYECR
jgi:hypothetical protein